MIIDIMNKRIIEIITNQQYTLKHKFAFLKIERELLKKNTLSGYLHDVDKLILYIFFNRDIVRKIHRYFSTHHERRASKEKHFKQMVIDIVSAKETKPDKQLTPYETLYKYYSHLENNILPLFKKYHIEGK